MKKHIAIIVFLVLSALFMLIFGINYSEIFGVLAVLVVYSAFVVGDVFRYCRIKWLKVLARIYQGVIALFVISFIVFEGIIWYNMSHLKSINQIPDENYAIVLGAGLVGSKPSVILKDRLNKAVEYLNLHKSTKLIVSGGQGVSEEIPEAEAMKRYLIQKGTSPDRIIEEDKSKTTMQNFEFSKKILEERNAQNQTVVVITSDFHLERAMILANIYGLKAVGLGAKTPFTLRVNFSIREYTAYIVDGLRLLSEDKV